jgi:hypothetical protein
LPNCVTFSPNSINRGSSNRPNFGKVKKIVVIFLMLIYGSATMGATVHLHYCMNELVGWSLWHSDKEECGRCGMKEDKTGCCKDEHKHFKLKTDHKKAVTTALITFNLTPAIITPIPDLNFQVLVKDTENYSTCHAPPDISDLKLHILHSVFLI